MSTLAWKPIGAADAGSFAEARRQAHNAAQWLVRMAHSFMPTARDNRHTLLRWDADRQAMVTQEFLPDLTLELRLPSLAMQFREGGRPAPHVFEFDDRTPAEAEAWVLVELLHRRLDRDRFSKALPYEVPNLMTGDAVPYVVETLESALAELAAWFTNASAVLGCIAEEHRPAAGGSGSEVLCWPETFHMGNLLPLDGVKSGSRRMLRVGFSPGDAKQTASGFYVSPHNSEGRDRPKAAGSILTAAELAASPDPGKRALDFLRAEIAKHRAAK
jgi:hypothetical protein